MRKILFALVIMVAMASCSPTSKESYLRKYDEFITEVSENSKTYSEKDWENATEKYEKFSGVWYSKFEKELTITEKLKVTKNQVQFFYYKNLQKSALSVKDFFKSLDTSEIKNQVQYYINNNMQSDLKKFYKEAQNAGNNAGEAVTKVLKEMNVNIDELKKGN